MDVDRGRVHTDPPDNPYLLCLENQNNGVENLFSVPACYKCTSITRTPRQLHREGLDRIGIEETEERKRRRQWIIFPGKGGGGGGERGAISIRKGQGNCCLPKYTVN